VQAGSRPQHTAGCRAPALCCAITWAAGAAMISERCEPAEFVDAALGWGRQRLDVELDQEIAAAELARTRAKMGLGPPPPGCHHYHAFLQQMRQWLRTGQFPRQGRRRTRELLAILGRAMAANGQLDPKAVEALRYP
jgi:hypothetical protein